MEEMTTAQSLAVARDSKPVAPTSTAALTGLDYAVGDQVAVTADDYGSEQTSGRVTAISTEILTIERQDATCWADTRHGATRAAGLSGRNSRVENTLSDIAQ